MNIKSNSKLKTAVLASILAISFSNPVFAVPGSVPHTGNISNIDLSKEFTIDISPSMVGWSGGDYYTYLYYTPVDKVVTGGRFDNFDEVTYKGGVLYLVKGEEIGDADSANTIRDLSATALGNAADIFGEGGITEDEIKDLISNVEGNQTVNGSQDITGDQTVEGEQTVNGGQTVTGGQTVNGDSTTNGNSTTTGNSTIKGDNNTEGDSNVEGDSNIGGDLNVDGDGTVDGDMNVGYEGADEDGDGTPDRPGDLNVAGNTNTEGNQDVTGDSHIGGNEVVDGNETVKGDSSVEGDSNVGGNQNVAGDSTIEGNSTVKGDGHIEGDLLVDGTSDLTGDTTVGSRDDNGAVVDRSDLDVTGNANLGGDTFVGFDGADDNGDGTPDRPGNMYIAGDTVIGVPGVPGAESNLHVTGNTTIDHDLYVGGEGHFDGNLYAPDLIFNGGKSLTGEISRLDGRIDTAGANAAALAGLHPLDFDEDQKLNFAAAVGSYQGASAMALGMFYRPDDRTMFNLGGTFGNRENMATLGISFALDGPNAVSRSSKKKMQEQIVQLTAANAVMAENNAKMQTELEELKAMVMELKAEKAA